MFKIKKFLAIGGAVLALSAISVTALAASGNRPAGNAAALTNRTAECVAGECQENGTGDCTNGNGAGASEEFKSAMLERRKAVLDAQVAAGKITQEQADKILADMQANMDACDGTGNATQGQRYGACSGSCFGTDSGSGSNGQGGQRGGNGTGLRDDSCQS